MKNQLAIWHKFVETQNPNLLNELLSDDVKFHSPFVWKPKEGKHITAGILLTATEVFEEFEYIREIVDKQNCMLEFEAKVGDLTVRGVDIMKFSDDGKIVDFEVMIRPANALQVIGMKMTERLKEKGLI